MSERYPSLTPNLSERIFKLMSERYPSLTPNLEAYIQPATPETCDQIALRAEEILAAVGEEFPSHGFDWGSYRVLTAELLDIAKSALVDVSNKALSEQPAKISITKPRKSFVDQATWHYNIKYRLVYPSTTQSLWRIYLVKSGAEHYPAVMMAYDDTPDRPLLQFEAGALLADLRSLASAL